MVQQQERHNISEGLYVFKQTNSKRYYARFIINGKWLSRATKEKELDKAIVKAIGIEAEYQFKHTHNVAIISTRKPKSQTFNVVADLAIKRMEDDALITKNKSYEKYVRAINNYHKPFFNECTFREIDIPMLAEFDEWRTNKIGRVPAKDTVKEHNAGLQRVFDEAVIQNHITQTELPKIVNNGRKTESRAAFTKDEYEYILEYAKSWIANGRTVKSRSIREGMYYYMQIAALTGIRVGSELDQLTWGDISIRKDKDGDMTTITVRKGKTTGYTGTRTIICKNDLQDVLKEFIAKNKKCKLNELIFNFKTGAISDNFTKLLNELKMKTNAHGSRTLYSFRHSYITWALEAGTSTRMIATQCGTSEKMIEDFYSHVVPSAFAKQLAY